MPFSIDTVQIRSFVAIAETGSFSRAAVEVGRTQSALSLQVRKLEDVLGVPLFERTSRRVQLTEAGEVFLGYARRILALQVEAYGRLRAPDVAGEIRLGTPEDFATHYLPAVLASFAKHHPRVQLAVSCDLTLNLVGGFERGEFDLILVKRDPDRVRGGQRVWREPLVWAAADAPRREGPIPLVLSPQPCIYRARAIAALDRARLPWHLSYTSPSLAGTVAAVRAGLGVTVLPAAMLPEGVHPIGLGAGLPDLADAEIALMKRDALGRAADLLAEHIVQSLEGLAR